MPIELKVSRAALSLCVLVCTLSACKTEVRPQVVAGPPPTQIAGHNTSDFTAALTYARLLQNQAQVAFLEGESQPFTAACDDPRVNVEMRPSLAVQSCRVQAGAENDAQVAVLYSNGWALLADAQGVRSVDAAQLPSLP